MIIQSIPVQKLVISEANGLDPIHLYLEDTGPGQGILTLRCYDKSWTAGWGGMGKDKAIAEFILSCDTDYLVNCLSRGISRTQFSGTALMTLARRAVVGRRRNSLIQGTSLADVADLGDLSRDEVRDLYDRAADLEGCESTQACPDTLMRDLFGDEWWFMADTATEPNPSYAYLVRIVEAMQGALRQRREETEALPA